MKLIGAVASLIQFSRQLACSYKSRVHGIAAKQTLPGDFRQISRGDAHVIRNGRQDRKIKLRSTSANCARSVFAARLKRASICVSLTNKRDRRLSAGFESGTTAAACVQNERAKSLMIIDAGLMTRRRKVATQAHVGIDR